MAPGSARSIATTGIFRPARAVQPPGPPPVEPLSATESHDFSLAAKARWPAAGAEARELVQSLAKSAAVVRPLHVGIFNESSCCDKPEPLFPILDTIPSCTRSSRAENVRSQPDRLARFDVLIFPGGTGTQAGRCPGRERLPGCQRLHPIGRRLCRNCAGGFLASAQYDWSLGLVNTSILTGDREIPGVGIRSMADRRPDTVQIELTAEGRSIFGDHSAPIDISFSGGPIFLGPKRDDLPLTIPLAHYSTEVSTYAAQRDHDWNPGDLRGQVRRRPCRCDQRHPESTVGTEFLVKLAALATARMRETE